MRILEKLPGRVAVHGLVFHDKKVIALKRSELDEDEANLWDIPGGGIKKGEDVEKGFLRELMEETGLSASEISVFGVHEVDDGSVDLFVTAETKESEIEISEEHNDYKWIELEELLDLQPGGLHLRAVQYLLKNNKRVVAYNEIPS